MPRVDMVNLETGWPPVKVDLTSPDATKLAPSTVALENRNPHTRRYAPVVAARLSLFFKLEHRVAPPIDLYWPAFSPDLTYRARHVIEARDTPKILITDPLAQLNPQVGQDQTASG